MVLLNFQTSFVLFRLGGFFFYSTRKYCDKTKFLLPKFKERTALLFIVHVRAL